MQNCVAESTARGKGCQLKELWQHERFGLGASGAAGIHVVTTESGEKCLPATHRAATLPAPFFVRI